MTTELTVEEAKRIVFEKYPNAYLHTEHLNRGGQIFSIKSGDKFISGGFRRIDFAYQNAADRIRSEEQNAKELK